VPGITAHKKINMLVGLMHEPKKVWIKAVK